MINSGSTDGTDIVARPLSDQIVESPRGHASQMNVGAALAHGDVLRFLHADTRVPPRSDLFRKHLCARTPSVAYSLGATPADLALHYNHTPRDD